MRRKHEAARIEEYVQVAERLRPYVEGSAVAGGDVPASEGAPDSETLNGLMERAVTLLTVMPRNQHRKTIEELVSPYDHEQGRRALDVLIDAAFVSEDEAGHVRRLR